MDLTPNYSFFIQIITFVILWQGLKRVVFDPFLQVLDARNARTVAAEADAQRLLGDVERSRAEYEQSLQKMRLAMAQEASAARLKQVRYFFDQDKAAASLLALDAKAVLSQLGFGAVDVDLRDFSNYPGKKPRPGVLELWLGVSK